MCFADLNTTKSVIPTLLILSFSQNTHAEGHPAPGCGGADMCVHYGHRSEYLELPGLVGFKKDSVQLFNTSQDRGIFG